MVDCSFKFKASINCSGWNVFPPAQNTMLDSRYFNKKDSLTTPLFPLIHPIKTQTPALNFTIFTIFETRTIDTTDLTIKTSSFTQTYIQITCFHEFWWKPKQKRATSGKHHSFIPTGLCIPTDLVSHCHI